MADIERNIEVWDRSWDWSREGEEWSDRWGGSDALWFGTLLPRIHPFLPASAILEIGPGFGRWTHYLKDACEHLVAVDLAARCVEHCQERFTDSDHVELHLNDGRSLEMVPDGSIDFAFSFDSLVHAEMDAIAAYLEQLAAKLRPDGIAFIHHSNIGAYAPLTALARRIGEPALGRLIRSGVLIDVIAWRAESVTAAKVAEHSARVGLSCISQEKIAWEHGPYLIDALSTLTPSGSTWTRPNRVIRNPLFGREGRRMAGLYSRGSDPQVPRAKGPGPRRPGARVPRS